MKVYVVESGEYSQRCVTAVYSSLERAMYSTEESDWVANEHNGRRWWDYVPDALAIWEFEVDAE